MAKQTNEILGLTLLLVSLGLFVISFLYIRFGVTDRELSALDTISIKSLLILFTFALLSFCGLVLYRIFYFPRPRRLLLNGFSIALMLSVSGMLSPFVLLKVQEVSSQDLSITFSGAVEQSGTVLFVALIVLFFFSREYKNLSIYEKEHGEVL